MSFNSNKPYNDIPLLPPRADIETKKILKKALAASNALAELKGISNVLPNPSILINSITLQEAKASSEIENVVTTHDTLFKAFTAKANNFDSSTKEVLRYRQAIWEGYQELTRTPVLTTNLIVKVHQKILNTTAEIRKTPGTKLVNNKKETIYTPPEGERLIRELLANLEKFMHSEQPDTDALIKAAIVHYQFEAIHPFTDGNGRTGRILIILYFILTKRLDLPILYLSRYIIENKNDYYRLLREVTIHNKWEEWILFILDGIEKTSISTLGIIKQISDSLEKTYKKVQAGKIKPVPKEVIELIYEQPYCKIEFILNRKIATRKTAKGYFTELERLGVLVPQKIGKEVIYLNTELYKILSKN